MGFRLFTIPALLPLVFSASIHAQLAGPATITDGDSLTVAGQRIRLFGIDAPESKQTCLAGRGERWPCCQRRSATQALARRIAGWPVACTERDRGRYGRIVAVCRVGGEDLNAWMVSQGLALAYRRYSTAYVGRERSAKAARRGLRPGDFVTPGTGAGANASQPPHLRPAPGRVESRGKSASRASASSTCPVPSTTNAPPSTPRRASAGSARRPRRGRRGGGGRSGECTTPARGSLSHLGNLSCYRTVALQLLPVGTVRALIGSLSIR